MEWLRAESGLRYRVAPSGEVVVRLDPGEAVLAESSRLVYRRGEVDWSLADGGRGVLAGWVTRTQRRAVGMEPRMSRYEGAGEVGFAPASPGMVVPVELAPGAADVVCQAESLVALEAGIRTEVALVRRIREAGSRTKLAMIWLRGEGVAFLCAHGTPVPVTLEEGEAVEAAWWAVAWHEATAEYRILTAGRSAMVRDTRTLMARITGPGRVVLQGQRGGMRGW
ncbi:MAG: AIM24 family protein [Acidobacteriota bacterium]|nr:AIM24 family protein [Acidobacteriota bacterium]